MNLRYELKEKLCDIKDNLRDLMSYTIPEKEPYDAQQKAITRGVQILEQQYQTIKQKNQSMDEHKEYEKITEEPRLVKTMCPQNEKK